MKNKNFFERNNRKRKVVQISCFVMMFVISLTMILAGGISKDIEQATEQVQAASNTIASSTNTQSLNNDVLFDITKSVTDLGGGKYVLDLTATAYTKKTYVTTVRTSAENGYHVIPADGYYLIDLWGGSGSSGYNNAVYSGGIGGSAGRVYGYIYLEKGDTLVYSIGTNGGSGDMKGGKNYGGNGGDENHSLVGAGNGGGYSAVYLFKNENGQSTHLDSEVTEDERLSSYIMIAGGGGGGGGANEAILPPNRNPNGGDGGSIASYHRGTVSEGVAGTWFGGTDGTNSNSTDDTVGHGGTNVPGATSSTGGLGTTVDDPPTSWANGGYGGEGLFRGGGGGAGYAGGSGGSMWGVLWGSDISGGGGGSSFIANSVTFENLSSEVKSYVSGGSGSSVGGSVCISYLGDDAETIPAQTETVSVSFELSNYFTVSSVDSCTKSGNTVTLSTTSIWPTSSGNSVSASAKVYFDAIDGFVGGNNVPIFSTQPTATVASTGASITAEERAMTDYVNVPISLTATGQNQSSSTAGTSYSVSSLYNDKYTTLRDNLATGINKDYIASVSEYYVKHGEELLNIAGTVAPTTTTNYTVGFDVTIKDTEETGVAFIGDEVVDTSVTAKATVFVLATDTRIWDVTANEIDYDLYFTSEKTLTESEGTYTLGLNAQQKVYTSARPDESGTISTSGGVKEHAYVVPENGWYYIEATGGDGGNSGTATGAGQNGAASTTANGGTGGEGGYTGGYIYLTEGTVVNINLGGKGTSSSNTGPIRATHDTGNAYNVVACSSGGSGGEATVISINSTEIMRAGGGGGAGGSVCSVAQFGLAYPSFSTKVGNEGLSGEISYEPVGSISESSDGGDGKLGSGGYNGTYILRPYSTAGKAGEAGSNYISSEYFNTANAPVEVKASYKSYQKLEPSSTSSGQAAIYCIMTDEEVGVTDAMAENFEAESVISKYFDVNDITMSIASYPVSYTSSKTTNSDGTYTWNFKANDTVFAKFTYKLTTNSDGTTTVNITDVLFPTVRTTSDNEDYPNMVTSNVTFNIKLTPKEGFLGGNDVPVLVPGAMDSSTEDPSSHVSDAGVRYTKHNVEGDDQWMWLSQTDATDYANVALREFTTEDLTITNPTITNGDSVDLADHVVSNFSLDNYEDWQKEFVNFTDIEAPGVVSPTITTDYSFTQTLYAKADAVKAVVIDSVGEVSNTQTTTVSVLYPVTNNVLYTDCDVTTVLYGNNLDLTLTLDSEHQTYEMPESIVVNVGGMPLNSSDYAYTVSDDKGSATLSVPTEYINDDIELVGTPTEKQYTITIAWASSPQDYDVPEGNVDKQTMFAGTAIDYTKYDDVSANHGVYEGYTFMWQWSDGYTDDTKPTTMPREDIMVVGVYDLNRYTLTVNYYKEGSTTTLQNAVVNEYAYYGKTYEVEVTDFAGYTCTNAVTSATMGAENQVINLYYSLDKPTLTASEDVTKTFDDTASTIKVTVAHEASVTYEYQWYKDGVEIDGATSSTYSVTNVADSGEYYVAVRALSKIYSEWTNSATITVNITARPVTITANNQTIVYGNNISQTAITHNLISGHTVELAGGLEVVGDQVVSAVDTKIVPTETALIKDANGVDETANYVISYESGALTITARPITFNLNKTYDGTANFADVTFTADNHADIVEGDTIILTGITANSASYIESGYVLTPATDDTDTLTATISGAENYAVTVQAMINRIKVDLPSATESHTYDGTEYAGVFYDSTFADYTLSTDPEKSVVSATDAGNYSATFSLKEPATHEWADGTIDDVTVDWSIAVRNVLISIEKDYDGTVNFDDVTFTAENHSDIFLDDFVQLTDITVSSATAGTYTPTATIVYSEGLSGDNYAVTIQAVIKRIVIEMPELNPVHVYDGNEYIGVFYDTTFADYTLLDGSVLTAINAGTYTATFVLKDLDNQEWSDGTTENVVLTWTIEQVEILIEISKVYDGLTITRDLTVEDGLVDGEAVSITISTTAAGNYPNCTYTATGDTASNYAITVNLDIAKLQVEKPTAIEGLVYTLSSGSAVTQTGVNYDTALTYYTRSGTVSTSYVGTYTATFTLRNTSNYEWSDGTTTAVKVEWSIAKRIVDVPTAIEGLVYTGSTQYGFGEDLDLTYFYRYSGSISGTSAGTYSATFALQNTSYIAWNDATTARKTVSWSIARAPITTKPTPIEGLVYTGSSQVGVTYNTSHGYSVSGAYATNAGSYTATFTPTSNYCWEDGTTTSISIEWSIARLKVAKPAPIDGLVYTGSSQTGINYNTTYYNYYSSGNLNAINAGSYSKEFYLKNTTNCEWEDGTTASVTVNWTIARAPITTLPTPIEGLIYTGSSQTGVTYNTSHGYSVSGAYATNAGSYTATFTPTSNYCWEDDTADVLNVEWSIARASAVKPTLIEEVRIYNGQYYTGVNYDTSDGYTIASGSVSAYEAGEHTVVFALDNNHIWEDNTLENVTITWSIAKAVVDKPAVVNGTEFTYDGEYHSPFDEETCNIISQRYFYEYSGTYRDNDSNSNGYTVTFTLKTQNCDWSDGDTNPEYSVSWIIHPLELDIVWKYADTDGTVKDLFDADGNQLAKFVEDNGSLHLDKLAVSELYIAGTNELFAGFEGEDTQTLLTLTFLILLLGQDQLGAPFDITMQKEPYKSNPDKYIDLMIRSEVNVDFSNEYNNILPWGFYNIDIEVISNYLETSEDMSFNYLIYGDPIEVEVRKTIMYYVTSLDLVEGNGVYGDYIAGMMSETDGFPADMVIDEALWLDNDKYLVSQTVNGTASISTYTREEIEGLKNVDWIKGGYKTGEIILTKGGQLVDTSADLSSLGLTGSIISMFMVTEAGNELFDENNNLKLPVSLYSSADYSTPIEAYEIGSDSNDLQVMIQTDSLSNIEIYKDMVILPVPVDDDPTTVYNGQEQGFGFEDSTIYEAIFEDPEINEKFGTCIENGTLILQDENGNVLTGEEMGYFYAVNAGKYFINVALDKSGAVWLAPDGTLTFAMQTFDWEIKPLEVTVVWNYQDADGNSSPLFDAEGNQIPIFADPNLASQMLGISFTDGYIHFVDQNGTKYTMADEVIANMFEMLNDEEISKLFAYDSTHEHAPFNTPDAITKYFDYANRKISERIFGGGFEDWGFFNINFDIFGDPELNLTGGNIILSNGKRELEIRKRETYYYSFDFNISESEYKAGDYATRLYSEEGFHADVEVEFASYNALEKFVVVTNSGAASYNSLAEIEGVSGAQKLYSGCEVMGFILTRGGQVADTSANLSALGVSGDIEVQFAILGDSAKYFEAVNKNDYVDYVQKYPVYIYHESDYSMESTTATLMGGSDNYMISFSANRFSSWELYREVQILPMLVDDDPTTIYSGEQKSIGQDVYPLSEEENMNFSNAAINGFLKVMDLNGNPVELNNLEGYGYATNVGKYGAIVTIADKTNVVWLAPDGTLSYKDLTLEWEIVPLELTVQWNYQDADGNLQPFFDENGNQLYVTTNGNTLYNIVGTSLNNGAITYEGNDGKVYNGGDEFINILYDLLINSSSTCRNEVLYDSTEFHAPFNTADATSKYPDFATRTKSTDILANNHISDWGYYMFNLELANAENKDLLGGNIKIVNGVREFEVRKSQIIGFDYQEVLDKNLDFTKSDEINAFSIQSLVILYSEEGFHADVEMDVLTTVNPGVYKEFVTLGENGQMVYYSKQLQSTTLVVKRAGEVVDVSADLSSIGVVNGDDGLGGIGLEVILPENSKYSYLDENGNFYISAYFNRMAVEDSALYLEGWYKDEEEGSVYDSMVIGCFVHNIQDFEIYKDFTPVVAPTVNSGLVYTGSEQVGVNYVTDSNYTMLDGAVTSATNAGAYSATFALNDYDVYVWDVDGKAFAEDLKLDWNIAKVQVAKPVADNTEFTYDGTEKTLLTMGEKYSLVGTIKETNANSYTAEFILDDSANYEWADGTIDNVFISWVINKIQVAKPYANATHIYDGNEYLGVNYDLTYYTLSTDPEKSVVSATVAGRYLAEFALNDSNNYEWADGTVNNVAVEWAISQAQIAMPTVITGLVYNGTEQSGVEYDETLGYTASGDLVATNAGEYTAIFTLDSNYAWIGGSFDDVTIDWSIARAEISAPIVNTGLVYNGTEQPGVEYNETFGYTASGDLVATNAGEYTAVFTLDSNHVWTGGGVDDANVTWSIAKKDATVTAENKSVTYGDKLVGLTATVNGVVEGDTFNYTLDTNYVQGTTGVGTVDIVVTLGANDNYNVSTTDGKLTVEKRSVTLVADDKNVIYGDAFSELTATASNLVDGDTLNYTLSANYTPGTTGVGEVAIVVALGENPNYEVSATNGTLTVTKRNATITADDQSITYGDTLDTSAYTFKAENVLESDTLTVAYTVNGYTTATAVGTEGITITPYAENDNYNFTFVDGTLSVTKKAVTITANNGTVTYGEEADVSGVGFVDNGIINGDVVEVTCSTDYTVGANAGTTHNIVPHATHNNYSFTFVNGALTVTKRNAAITADNQTITYGDTLDTSAYTFKAENVLESDTLAVTYTVNGYTTATAVGTTGITITPYTENDNYNFTFVDGTLSVTKKAVSITANNGTVTYGEEADVSGVGFVDNGIINGDVVEVTYSTDYTVGANAGTTHNIVPHATHNNYEFSFTNGTLTVEKRKATVVADNKSVVYGGDLPELTATASGVYGSDVLNYTLGTDYVAGTTGVGMVYITVILGTNDNYDVITTNGTLTVVRKEIATPTANTGLVYNGIEQVGVNCDETLGYTVSGDTKATSAGNYTAVFTLDGNHAWIGGSVESTTIDWSIAKAQVALPYANVTHTFDGTEYVGVNYDSANSKVESGDVKATNAGEYSAVCALNDRANYEWIDGTVANVTVNWNIARKAVEKPVADTTTFAYDGAEHVLLTLGEGYVLADGTVQETNANDYSAEFALDSNYVWADNTLENVVINWTITKKEVTVTAKDQTINASEEISQSEYTVGDLAEGHVAVVLLSVDGEEILVVVTINDANGDDATANYDVTTVNGILTILYNYTVSYYWINADGDEEHAETVTGSNVINAVITVKELETIDGYTDQHTWVLTSSSSDSLVLTADDQEFKVYYAVDDKGGDKEGNGKLDDPDDIPDFEQELDPFASTNFKVEIKVSVNVSSENTEAMAELAEKSGINVNGITAAITEASRKVVEEYILAHIKDYLDINDVAYIDASGNMAVNVNVVITLNLKGITEEDKKNFNLDDESVNLDIGFDTLVSIGTKQDHIDTLSQNLAKAEIAAIVITVPEIEGREITGVYRNHVTSDGKTISNVFSEVSAKEKCSTDSTYFWDSKEDTLIICGSKFSDYIVSWKKTLTGPRSDWSFVSLILTIVTVLVMFMLIGKVSACANSKKVNNDGKKKRGKKTRYSIRGGMSLWVILSLLVVVAAIAVFVVYNSFTQPMVVINDWTLISGIVAGVQVVLLMFATMLTRREKVTSNGRNNSRPTRI